ncbi:hypothetical protein HU200_058202 [Digitaria exilis]|uniref:Uncharacterized protein n=1 Tax=Digitaria exilis TaxID=1010633 RepID=A0A835AN63_9POAL|nr:hypothetical protein HU200_058202 [Digitaria exilis]
MSHLQLPSSAHHTPPAAAPHTTAAAPHTAHHLQQHRTPPAFALPHACCALTLAPARPRACCAAHAATSHPRRPHLLASSGVLIATAVAAAQAQTNRLLNPHYPSAAAANANAITRGAGGGRRTGGPDLAPMAGAFWATRALEVVKRNDGPGLLWKRIKLTTTRKNNAKKRLKRLWQVRSSPLLFRSIPTQKPSGMMARRVLGRSGWLDCCSLILRANMQNQLEASLVLHASSHAAVVANRPACTDTHSEAAAHFGTRCLRGGHTRPMPMLCLRLLRS